MPRTPWADWVDRATTVFNFEKDGENLKVVRNFLCHRAVTRVEGRSIFRFPETPGSNIFEYLDVAIRWPPFKSRKQGGFELKVTQPTPRRIQVRLFLPAGVFRGAEKAGLESALKEYKDLFSSSLVSG